MGEDSDDGHVLKVLRVAGCGLWDARCSVWVGMRVGRKQCKPAVRSDN